MNRLRQQLNAVQVDGSPVPFAHPNKDPQRVLGVLVTPTMNWNPQIHKSWRKPDSRPETSLNLMLRHARNLAWIQTCLKPYLTYSFPLTYLSKQDLYRLDAVVAQTAKKALRLPLATPTGLMLQQQTLSGAGVESLLIDYAQLSIAHLTRALNDTGKLGICHKAPATAAACHLGKPPHRANGTKRKVVIGSSSSLNWRPKLRLVHIRPVVKADAWHKRTRRMCSSGRTWQRRPA